VGQTKLTIRLPQDLLEGAKWYAREHHTILTPLMTGYLPQLGPPQDPLADAPVVRRQSGILWRDVSIEDYHRYLEAKHGSPA
jgi:hypothetical protein